MSDHSSRGSKWQTTRLRILNRDEWICHTCGDELEEGVNATVDHVIPKAKGGTDNDDNLVAMCKPCNDRKQDRELVRTNYFSPAWLPEGWPWAS